MFKKIKNWFKNRKIKHVEDDLNYDDDDPLFEEVLMRSFTTKKMVVGSCDEEGNVSITEYDMNNVAKNNEKSS